MFLFNLYLVVNDKTGEYWDGKRWVVSIVNAEIYTISNPDVPEEALVRPLIDYCFDS